MPRRGHAAAVLSLCPNPPFRPRPASLLPGAQRGKRGRTPPSPLGGLSPPGSRRPDGRRRAPATPSARRPGGKSAGSPLPPTAALSSSSLASRAGSPPRPPRPPPAGAPARRRRGGGARAVPFRGIVGRRDAAGASPGAARGGEGGRAGGREGGGRPAASRAGSGRAGPAPSLPPPPPHHGKWAGAGREQRPPAPPQPPSPPPGAAAGPAAQPPSTGAFSGLRLRAAGTGFLRPGRRAGAGPGADPRRGRPGRCCPKSLKQTEVFAGCPKKPSPRGGGLKPGSASRIPLSWRAGGLGVVPKRCGSGSFVLGKNETWGFLKSRSAGIIRVGFRGKTCSLESACQPVC